MKHLEQILLIEPSQPNATCLVEEIRADKVQAVRRRARSQIINLSDNQNGFALDDVADFCQLGVIFVGARVMCQQVVHCQDVQLF